MSIECILYNESFDPAILAPIENEISLLKTEVDDLASRFPIMVDTMIGTSWTKDTTTGVKSQTIVIEGVTADNRAKVWPAYDGDGTAEGYAAFVEQQNQFLNRVNNGFAETVEGGITFNIFGDATTVKIPISVEVI